MVKIESISADDHAYTEIVEMSENKINGLIIIGVDTEFVNDCESTPYLAGETQFQFVGNQLTHPDYHGQFVWFMQIPTLS